MEKAYEYRHLLDAVELSYFNSPLFNINKKAAAFADEFGLAKLANSDTHTLYQFGRNYSLIDADHDKVTFHKINSRIMIDLPSVKVKGRSADEVMEVLEKAVRSQKPEDKIIRIKLTDIPEETYRALPFNKINELKNEAFSLDVQFQKGVQNKQ